jgi:hypothetical protein
MSALAVTQITSEEEKTKSKCRFQGHGQGKDSLAVLHASLSHHQAITSGWMFVGYSLCTWQKKKKVRCNTLRSLPVMQRGTASVVFA